MIEAYLDIFATIVAERAAAFEAQQGLTLKSGEGLGAAILKVLKPEWTADPVNQFLNTNGVFFSIWVDPACEQKGIARYNLHAKKLRFIKGERFEARQFVRSFRGQVDLAGWPNVSLPKGPITLFEGQVKLDIATLSGEALELMDRFVKLVPTIERTLAS